MYREKMKNEVPSRMLVDEVRLPRSAHKPGKKLAWVRDIDLKKASMGSSHTKIQIAHIKRTNTIIEYSIYLTIVHAVQTFS